MTEVRKELSRLFEHLQESLSPEVFEAVVQAAGAHSILDEDSSSCCDRPTTKSQIRLVPNLVATPERT